MSDMAESQAQSLVPWSRKRANLASSSERSSNLYLDEHLLIEILCRLPTTKYAIQCKCVCKNWYSLISTPYFVSRFLTHHIDDDDDNDGTVDGRNNNFILNYQNPSGFIFSCCNWEHGDYTRLIVSNEPMLKSCDGFQLSYLPERKESIDVLAVFNDLILCGATNIEGNLKHYICNPFAMQFVALPTLNRKHMAGTRVGFVCEPHCFKDSRGEYTVNSQYRFRVVSITRHITGRFYVDTYCSETSKWSESVLSNANAKYFSITNIVSCNGKLHWFNGKDIVAYDPFNTDRTCFIDGSKLKFARPLYDDWHTKNYFIGVCRGLLRILQLASSFGIDTSTTTTLTVWELEGYEAGEWRLVHKDYFKPMKILKGSSAIPRAFHPTNGNIVYFNFSNFVTLYNMGTREMELLGMIPYNYDSHAGKGFPIVLPWWPTPIPTPS